MMDSEQQEVLIRCAEALGHLRQAARQVREAVEILAVDGREAYDKSQNALNGIHDAINSLGLGGLL